MQPLEGREFEEFTKDCSWKIVHDGNTQMYQVVNRNGNRLGGMFTQRLFAINALKGHISRTAFLNRKQAERKKSRAS